MFGSLLRITDVFVGFPDLCFWYEGWLGEGVYDTQQRKAETAYGHRVDDVEDSMDTRPVSSSVVSVCVKEVILTVS